MFFQNYNLPAIVEWINQDISQKTSSIKIDGIKNWFTSWLRDQDIAKTQEEAFKIFSQEIMVEREDDQGNFFYTINEPYLYLLLAELGIAKVPQNSL